MPTLSRRLDSAQADTSCLPTLQESVLEQPRSPSKGESQVQETFLNKPKKPHKSKMNTQTCEYTNDGTRITQPGKFEGQPVFAPYYWGVGLEGCADEDNGSVFKFKFRADELNPDSPIASPFAAELKQWLGTKRTLHMSEDSQGFVTCF